MVKLKVKALDCVILRDPTGFLLDISHDALANNPGKVYEIPDSVFWRRVIEAKRLVLVGATAAEEKGPDTAKEPKTTKGATK